MRETWYVLEDDSPANPAECSVGEDGVFRHKGGVAVKMRNADTPMSRGVDIDPDAAPASSEVSPKPKVKMPGKNRELKAGDSKKYETR